MAIRDSLVLQMCCGADSMSYVRFEFAVETAFNEKNINDHRDKCFELHDLDSQMHLSCNTIRTLARDGNLFDRAMPNIFGPMSAVDLQILFAAYV